ncbi:choice-of-anchor D domain-containing protein [Dactylosporangium cerinum]|uniref:Choice-of-anchor D domain-containing protein n=1 Tax=Dactylosporangium cerinum TaxID=1434730 RepID=A0ABV9VLN5_9ACTN
MVVTLSAIPFVGTAAAAGPTAPFDAFTTTGDWWNHDYDSTNATFTMSRWGSEGFRLDAMPNGGGQSSRFRALVQPNFNQTLNVGTWRTESDPGASTYQVQLFGDDVGCLGKGSITIHEFTRDPATHAITSVVASYYQECNHTYGELRYHSTSAYSADAVVAAPDFPHPTLVFGTVWPGYTSAAQTLTVRSIGRLPRELGAVTLGGAAPDQFSIVGDSCAGTTLPAGQSCAVEITAHPTVEGAQNARLSIEGSSIEGLWGANLNVHGDAGAGRYVPVNPSRLLDTRNGAGPLGANTTLALPVTGVGSVPPTGVSAVVLNMTVTGPTSAGYLTVYPTGAARPTTSSLNFPAGWTGANSVTVPVGAGGKVDIYNPAGTVHVITDVVGFYTTANVNGLAGGDYVPLTPSRVLDTRNPDFGGPLNGFEGVTIPVELPTGFHPHVRAFAVNVTAVAPQLGGYLTAWNGTGPVPLTSMLNLVPQAVVSNFAIVPTALCAYWQCGGRPSITIYNGSSGKTHVVVDIIGIYDDGELGGLRFQPLGPTRITDTRQGAGAHPLGPASSTTIRPPGMLSDVRTVALAANLTGVNPSNSTYLTLWPTGENRPDMSNLNLAQHEIRSNATIIPLSSGGQFNVFNAAWTVDLVIDVAGTFVLRPGAEDFARWYRASSVVPQRVTRF